MTTRSEEKTKLRNAIGLNQFVNLEVVGSETEEGLVELLASFATPVYVKAMYYSPTSKRHIAYIIHNKNLNKDQ